MLQLSGVPVHLKPVVLQVLTKRLLPISVNEKLLQNA